MKVAKFGGSSLADNTQFEKVKAIIARDPSRQIIVVSALGKRQAKDDKITDMLYLLHAHYAHGIDYQEFLQVIQKRYQDVADSLGLSTDVGDAFSKIAERMADGTATLDYLVSRGEYLTAMLMADYLGYTFVDAQAVIRFRYNGEIDYPMTQGALEGILSEASAIVVPGFYGVYPNGIVKLMSRGGSDITGAILARVAGAEVYENWTDVSGILMADPRIVSKPQTIARISYRELREMSYLGASVIHEEAVFPAQAVGIPIHIRNTNDPKAFGTLIHNQDCQTTSGITGICGKKHYLAVNIDKFRMTNEVGFIARVLGIFQDFGFSVDHVPTGVDNLSVLLEKPQDMVRFYDMLETIQTQIQPDALEITEDLALIGVVGPAMKGSIGLHGTIFSTLGELGIPVSVLTQGALGVNLLFGVHNRDYDRAISSLYERLVLR
jgi:aspartate kinase